MCRASPILSSARLGRAEVRRRRSDVNQNPGQTPIYSHSIEAAGSLPGPRPLHRCQWCERRVPPLQRLKRPRFVQVFGRRTDPRPVLSNVLVACLGHPKAHEHKTCFLRLRIARPRPALWCRPRHRRPAFRRLLLTGIGPIESPERKIWFRFRSRGYWPVVMDESPPASQMQQFRHCLFVE